MGVYPTLCHHKVGEDSLGALVLANRRPFLVYSATSDKGRDGGPGRLYTPRGF